MRGSIFVQKELLTSCVRGPNCSDLALVSNSSVVTPGSQVSRVAGAPKLALFLHASSRDATVSSKAQHERLPNLRSCVRTHLPREVRGIDFRHFFLLLLPLLSPCFPACIPRFLLLFQLLERHSCSHIHVLEFRINHSHIRTQQCHHHVTRPASVPAGEHGSRKEYLGVGGNHPKDAYGM